MACLNPFQKFRGFNDWKRKKHAAPRLQAEELSAHATALFSLVEKPYTSGWEGFQDDLERLSEALAEYARYLTSKKNTVLERQRASHPARQLETNIFIQVQYGCSPP